MRTSLMLLVALLAAPSAAYARPVIRSFCGRALTMQAPRPDDDASAKQALEAANAKLEELNAVGSAPSSWADLGNPQVPVANAEVPAFLAWLPGVLGFFAFITLFLNQMGVFGSGPSVDELNQMADDFAASLENVK